MAQAVGKIKSEGTFEIFSLRLLDLGGFGGSREAVVGNRFTNPENAFDLLDSVRWCHG